MTNILALLAADPADAPRKMPDASTILERVLLRCRLDMVTGCWLYTGTKVKGYGYINSRVQGAGYTHHVTFDAIRGYKRDGLWTDHLCRTPDCANPWHLELVAPGENTRRGYWAHGHPRETHCRAGHAYAETGVYQPPNGLRRCRVCQDKIIATQCAKRRAARKARRDHLG